MDADAVFKALADPHRRRLLDTLHERSGLTLTELCESFDMRRQSASQHLELLEAANLVTSVRDGRRKLHYLNPVPLRQIQTRWIWKFEEQNLSAIDTIRKRAEEIAMTEATTGKVPSYIYTIYIRATPDDVWRALTDPETTGQFWGHSQVSNWTVGSPVEHIRVDGSGIVDAMGTVVEADRPRRLSFSFDDPKGLDDPTFEPSVVSFDIESDREIVKLTVSHTLLRTAEELRNIGMGWPTVLSNLKTLLETGEVLPQAPWEFHADERAARMTRNG